MEGCSIKYCLNKIDSRRSLRNGITFHRFPRSRINRNYWTDACGRQNFKPTGRSVICSVHFEETDFRQTSNGPVLSHVAIPTLCLPTQRIETLCRKRKMRIPIHESEIIHTTDEEFNLLCKENKLAQFVLNPADILAEANKIAESSNDVANQVLNIAVKNTVGHPQSVNTYINPHETDIQKNLSIWKNQVRGYDAPPLSYKCYECCNFWWHLEEFREHLLSHQRINITVEFFHRQPSLAAYKSQTSTKNNNLEPKCPKCGKDFGSLHIKSKLHCSHCIAQHSIIDNKISFSTGKIQCRICKRYFDTEETFEQHLPDHHDVRSDSPIVSEYLVCNLCDSRYPSRYHHHCLNRDSLISCIYCFRSFVHSSLSREHMKNNRGIFICEICGILLPSHCMKFEHMLTHSNKYTIVRKCKLCLGFKVFISSEGAALHLVVQHKYFVSKTQCYFYYIIVPKSCLNIQSRREFNEITDENPNAAAENEEEDTKSEDDDNMEPEVDDPETEIERLDEEDDDEMNVDEEQETALDLSDPSKKVDNNMLHEVDNMEPEIEMLEEEFYVDKNQDTGVDLNEASKKVNNNIFHEVDYMEPEVEMREEEFNEKMNACENSGTGIDLIETSKYNEAELPIHNEISEDEQEDYAEDIIKLDFGTDEHVENIPVEEATVTKEAEVPKKESDTSLIQPIAEEIYTDATETIVDQNKVTTKKTGTGKVFEATPLTLEKEQLLRYSEVTDVNKRGGSIDKCDNTHVKDIVARACKICGSSLPQYKCRKCKVTFKSMTAYFDHFLYHSYNFFTCPACHELFYNAKLLCQHLQSHYLVKFAFRHVNWYRVTSFQCRVKCKALSLFKDFIEYWESRIKIGKKYPEIEDINDYDSNNVEHGVGGETKNRLRNEVFECNLCKSKFTMHFNCKMHLIEHFFIDAKTIFDGQEFNCKICRDGKATVVLNQLHIMKPADIVINCKLCIKTLIKQDQSLEDAKKGDQSEEVFGRKSESEAHLKESQNQKKAGSVTLDKADDNVVPEDVINDEVSQNFNYSHEVEVVTEEEPDQSSVADEIIPSTSNFDLETVDQVDSEYYPQFSWNSPWENSDNIFSGLIDAVDPMLSEVDGLRSQVTNRKESLENKSDQIDSYDDDLMLNKEFYASDEDTSELGDNQIITSNALENASNYMTNFPIQEEDKVPTETNASPDLVQKVPEKKKRRSRRTPYIRSPKPTQCAMKFHNNCELFTEKIRQKICKSFWSLDPKGRRKFILKLVKQNQPKTHKNGVKRKREMSRKYYFKKDGTAFRVCYAFFVATLCISHWPVANAFKEKN